MVQLVEIHKKKNQPLRSPTPCIDQQEIAIGCEQIELDKPQKC